MKRYERRPVTVERDVVVEVVCDGCGQLADDTPMGRLVEVVIAIDEGEEGGHRTELDLCDGCLVERAPAFVAAGALAPLVTGWELPMDGDAP